MFDWPDDTIIGDLVKYGWVVFQYMGIDSQIQTEINKAACMGFEDKSELLWIVLQDLNHKKKYNCKSSIPMAREMRNLEYFGKYKGQGLCSKINYNMGIFILLKNDGPIYLDQKHNAYFSKRK